MFFLLLILVIAVSSTVFITSVVKLEFKNYIIQIPKTKDQKEMNLENIQLNVYILGKIKIANIDIKKAKNITDKVRNKGTNFKFKIKELPKNLNIVIEKLKINMIIGLEDACQTAIAVGGIYSILEGAIFPKVKKAENRECNISPEYNRKIIFIKLDGIFKINMWNIINTIFQSKKKIL